jgi:hypothetical protein
MNRFSFRTGLMRDQGIADHMLGHIPDLMRGFHQMHPAFVAVLKMALSPTPGMNLRLHDKAVARKAAGNGFRLFCRFGHSPPGHRDSGGRKKIPSLIFVNVHKEEKLMIGRVGESAF